MKIALAVVALGVGSSAAYADGGYVLADAGGTAMRGDLSGYAPAFRYRVGAGATLGDWSLEGWYAGDRGVAFGGGDCMPSSPETACPVGGSAFGGSGGGVGSLISYGVDVRRAFTLVYGRPETPQQKWFRPRLQAYLRAGLREAHGSDGMTGLSGTGVGAAAGVDLNVRVGSVYLELAGDRYDFGGAMSNAETFHVVLGERFGFSM